MQWKSMMKLYDFGPDEHGHLNLHLYRKKRCQTTLHHFFLFDTRIARCTSPSQYLFLRSDCLLIGRKAAILIKQMKLMLNAFGITFTFFSSLLFFTLLLLFPPYYFFSTMIVFWYITIYTSSLTPPTLSFWLDTISSYHVPMHHKFTNTKC